MSPPTILPVILGPTAMGKTEVAANFCSRINGEVISADSRQVYRRMDIGTGKDLNEYKPDGIPIPYHLIDICEPGEEYNVHRFQQDFTSAFDDIISRDKQPVLCGGTGLYIQSILEGYDLTSIPSNPQLRDEFSSSSKERLIEIATKYTFPQGFHPDHSSRKRLIRAIEMAEYLMRHPLKKGRKPQMNPLIFGITAEPNTRRKMITERLKYRLEHGLIREVRGLLDEGIPEATLKKYGLEYKFVTDHLKGTLDKVEMFGKLNTAIHQFAKRQMTWFRKMEREGYRIHWLDASTPLEIKVQQIVDKYCGKID